MEILLISILTSFIVSAILVVMISRIKKNIYKIAYKQSDTHFMLKNFFSRVSTVQNNNESQMDRLIAKNAIKVVMIDGMAYWVDNNVFYMSEVINNKPDISNAKPIDTSNLSKEDLDKMLFILDNLKDEKK